MAIIVWTRSVMAKCYAKCLGQRGRESGTSSSPLEVRWSTSQLPSAKGLNERSQGVREVRYVLLCFLRFVRNGGPVASHLTASHLGLAPSSARLPVLASFCPQRLLASFCPHQLSSLQQADTLRTEGFLGRKRSAAPRPGPAARCCTYSGTAMAGPAASPWDHPPSHFLDLLVEYIGPRCATRLTHHLS